MMPTTEFHRNSLGSVSGHSILSLDFKNHLRPRKQIQMNDSYHSYNQR